MSRTWYGSVQNRLEENRQFCDEIKVGTGMTEYSWSDRDAYEVIEVKSQKNVIVRKYDHRHVGDGQMDNSWELISNPDNPTYELTKRGKYWYYTNTWTAEEVESTIAHYKEKDPINGEAEVLLHLALGGFDIDRIRTKGKQTKYRRANVSFGVANYYYDYSF